ncbi:MAG: DNA polymerase III subunit beta, partial [Candidatus Levybacteria bacterium]|nr:DNA polymerase III subunit beta [Candidatus Levybacteria bacterium]
VLFAASQDIGRPALSGVFIEKEEGEEGVRLVATDGFRLSLKKNFAKGVFDKKQAQKYLFPSRVTRELQQVKGDEKSIVFYIASSGNQVVFEAGGVEIVGRLIEAEYPDYKKIIPTDFETSAVFDKKEALDAVKTCLVFAREAANIIRVGIGAGKTVFRASAPSVGESEVEIEAEINGEENEIAFNGRYLLDFLSNTDSEDVRFEMTGPLNPGVFKLPKDPDYLHIIMPIRVGE